MIMTNFYYCGYNPRNRLNMYVETVKTGLAFRSVFIEGIIKFNELDVSLKFCDTFEIFKRRLNYP